MKPEQKTVKRSSSRQSAPKQSALKSSERDLSGNVSKCANCLVAAWLDLERPRDTNELSSEVNLSPKLIRNMARHGELPSKKVRRKYQFHLPSVRGALGLPPITVIV